MTVEKVSENVFHSENGEVTVSFDGETPKTVSGNGFTLEILNFREE